MNFIFYIKNKEFNCEQFILIFFNIRKSQFEYIYDFFNNIILFFTKHSLYF